MSRFTSVLRRQKAERSGHFRVTPAHLSRINDPAYQLRCITLGWDRWRNVKCLYAKH